METESAPESLDDIRKKRLAYYQGLGSGRAENKNSNEQVGVKLLASYGDSQVNADELSGRERMKNEIKAPQQPTLRMHEEPKENSSHFQPENEGKSAPLKTSAFYFEVPRDGEVNAKVANLSMNHSPQNAIQQKFEISKTSNQNHVGKPGNDLDAYNETVERLIKATKEELLGMKSKDDIWDRLKNGSLSQSDKDFQQHSQPTQKGEVNTEKKSSVSPELLQYHYSDRLRSSSAKEEANHNSPTGNEQDRPVKSNNGSHEWGHEAFNSHFNGFEHKPLYSHQEPSTHKHHSAIPDQPQQKSLTSVKVEEIFSSRQISRSYAPQGKIPIADSQEITEEMPDELVRASGDAYELGLSTHRPESDTVDKTVADSEELNLGDTVSKELRMLLGEEKFQQFIMKAKQDIEDLHQERLSERSEKEQKREKTPRLLKERTVTDSSVNRSVTGESGNRRRPSESDSREDRKNGVVRSRKTSETNTQSQSHIMSSEAERRGGSINKSEDFTPRQSDGDAVHDMIGKYMLTKDTDEKSKLMKHVAESEKSTKNIEPAKEIKSILVKKTVPELNLSEINKPEPSPRPKLNRPKHEPHTIYQDKKSVERDVSKSTADARIISSTKNYEQVVVPRNVCFSSSEIYSQAAAIDQSFMSLQATSIPNTPTTPTPYFEGDPRQQNPYGVPMYTIISTAAPMTPTTPITPHQMDPSIMYYNQYQHMQAPVEDPTNQRRYMTSASRQTSLTSDSGKAAAGMQYSQQSMVPPYNQEYQSMPNFSGYYPPPVSMTPRFSSSTMPGNPPLMLPHPPTSSPESSYFGQVYPPNQTIPVSQGIPMGYPAYPYPVMMMAPHPPATPHTPIAPTTLTSSQMQPPSYQAYQQQAADKPWSQKEIEKETTTESVKKEAVVKYEEETWVDTDLQSTVVDDNPEKVTLVEESTFTSVSQIHVKEESPLMPHPPATKKGKSSSPRRPPVLRSKPDAQRHIEGIRQHHEQRRQQQEEKLSDEQILEKQRKFAKASIERYFSSLENVYRGSYPDDNMLPDDYQDPIYESGNEDDADNSPRADEPSRDIVEDVFSTVELHTEKQEENAERVNKGINNRREETTKMEKADRFIDAMAKQPVEKKQVNKVDSVDDEIEDRQEVKKSAEKADYLRDANDNIQADRQRRDKGHMFNEENAVKNEEKKPKVTRFSDHYGKGERQGVIIYGETDNDGGTEVNTEVSIEAGGVTERLKELGIVVEHGQGSSKGEKETLGDKKRGDKKGKLLIVCPECRGLNKEYMSWCSQCGEMIIGVEPVLVSKNREGKLRMKPVSKEDASQLKNSLTSSSHSIKDITIEKAGNVSMQVNYEQDIPEKPFVLNLNGIKSPEKEDSKKHGSPMQSDGKDSGRPSSGDLENEMQSMKIEQEVVDDICESISDPVVKGYVKSHFAKKKQGSFDSKMVKEKLKEELVANLIPETDTVQFIHTVMNAKDREQVGVVKASPGFVKEDNAQVFDELSDLNAMHKGTVKERIAMFDKNPEVLKCDLDNHKSWHDFDMELESVNTPLASANDRSGGFEKGTDISLVPKFSSHIPVHQEELALNLPANSMDFSMDYSQADSQMFNESLNHSQLYEGMTEEEKKAERKKERRRKRGHGAIDVEVFGYDESRESRNSSRTPHSIPTLNLGGNSSDDESIISDAKPEPKPDLKLSEVKVSAKVKDNQSLNKGSLGAWIPPLIPEESARALGSPEERSPERSTLTRSPQKFNMSRSPEKSPVQMSLQRSNVQGSRERSDVQRSHEKSNMQGKPERSKLSRSPERSLVTEEGAARPVSPPLVYPHDEKTHARGDNHRFREEFNDDWQLLFDPKTEPQEEADEEQLEDDIENNGDPDQPFLQHLLNQAPGSKPKSSKGKPVKSKVRQSLEEPGYQRKWVRSSIAWSSYNNGELKARSSLDLRSSADQSQGQSRGRPASASKSRQRTSADDDPDVDRATPRSKDIRRRPASAPRSRHYGNRESISRDTEESSFDRPGTSQKSRPESANVYGAKKRKKKGKHSSHGDDLDLSIDLDLLVEHRLPRPGMLNRLQDHMASPQSTYDKYLEMTPRIHAGTVSRWQCLPDEILLHIFAYLDQTSLTRVAQVCQQYYRVAMDESLWKYITIKKRSDLDDECLSEVSKRHPTSLALIQCQGERVTAKGLRDLFRECAETLKELNIARCSRGALCGDSLLLHAAARCHNLTHIDTSWCNITDSGLMAISNTCNRLESLCLNGCQAVTNDGLETVLRKHGSHLRVLELFGCFNISPRGLRCIANNCINLISLNLGQCYKVTDSCIAQLSTSLGRVETLDLRGCKQIKDNCLRRVVKNCPRLKHLSLANCPNITDVSVLEISTYLTDIRSIDLSGCKNITDGSIRALVNTCKNLRHIDISSTGCTHRSVSMIANFANDRLESLKINFLSDVTEQSLIKLAKHCHRLKSVHMYGCPSVRHLDKVMSERPSFSIEM